MLSDKKFSLEDKKRVQYGILKELDSFCTNNGLRYFLAYGTLLGAVRHKGFIPWDDDIDVFMPYDDFISFINQYHSDRYSVRSYLNDSVLIFEGGRLYDDFSYRLFHGHKSLGCCIDIYLLYGVPEDLKKQNKMIRNIQSTRELRHNLTRLRSFLVGKKLWPSSNLSFKFGNRLIRWKMRHINDYSFDESLYVTATTSRIVFKKEIFSQSVRLPFEDSSFLVPIGYDDFLRERYGDYMKFPPLEDRKPYHLSDYYWK